MVVVKARQIRGVAAYAVAPLLGLVTGPVLAYALGPHGRGEVAALVQPVTVASGLAVLGIPSAVTYFTARRPSHGIGTYRQGLALSIVPIFVTIAALVVYALPTSAQLDLPLALVIGVWCATLANAVVTIRRSWLQGLARWRRLDAERVFGSALRAAAIGALALMGIHDSAVFAIIMMITFIGGSLLLWAPRVRAGGGDQGLTWQDIVRYAAPASVGTVAAYGAARLDQLLMPSETSAVELGYYAVSVTVAEMPLILGTLVARDALQMASAGDSIRAIARHSAIYFLAATAGTVILIVAASWYTPLFFGPAFDPAIFPTQVLLVGTLIGVGASLTTAILSGRGRPGASSTAYAAGLAVTIAAFVIGWGHIGAQTAAFITVGTQFVTLVISISLLVWSKRVAPRSRPTSDQPMEHP